MATLEDIENAARSWVGTRFHYQGRLKKTSKHAGGVDCLGLLVGVALELDLHTKNGMAIAELDKADYPHSIEGNYLSDQLAQHLVVLDSNDLRAGCILIFNIKSRQQHSGIATLYNGKIMFVHAYAQARKVVETELDEEWRGKISNNYSLV